MFESILEESVGTLSVSSAVICMVCSLILGIIIALVHSFTSKYSKNFVITLAVLPVLVQVVIMMVNGNLGTSVAVLGAFSLVRFRSIPGNSKEIVSIFFAMAVGLATGMGHVVFATVITVMISIMLIIYSKTKFGDKKEENKKLKVIIPEDLDYTSVFDDIFDKYTKKVTLERVKTTNMGSMFELSYDLVLNKDINEKEFIDDLRCRNGNLNIMLSRPLDSENEL